MAWFVYIDSGVAFDDDEVASEEEAKEMARLKFMEWLQIDGKAGFELAWVVERED